MLMLYLISRRKKEILNENWYGNTQPRIDSKAKNPIMNQMRQVYILMYNKKFKNIYYIKYQLTV